MLAFFKRNSGRRKFRLTSMILIAGAVVAILTVREAALSSEAAFVVIAAAASLYVVLVILTYLRLKNALLLGWWLLPMLIIFDVGPRWQIDSWSWGSISFSPRGLLCLVPVVIGWFAVAKARDHATMTGAEAG